MPNNSWNLSGSSLACSPDAAPPWFRTAMDQVTEKLDGLTAQMEGVNVRLDDVRDQVGSLREQLNKVERISAMVRAYFIFEDLFFTSPFQSYNRQLATGADIHFEEVPFPDGTRPTTAPVRSKPTAYIFDIK